MSETARSERPARGEEALFARPLASIAAVLLGAAAVLLPSIAAHDLWAPDEPRYAEVAREMALRGDYLLPHLNGEPYPDKPPLYFWLAAFSARVFGGFSEFAVRFPSALSALGLLAITWRLGLDLFGRRAAFFAAACLATTALFLERATRAVLDPTLALFVAAALWTYRRGIGNSSLGRALSFGALGGLGVLTKGPVGLLVPSIVAGADFVRRRRRAPPVATVLAGFGAAAVVVAVWVVPACLLGGEAYADEILFRQNVNRAVAPWNHEQPLYYYLLYFPLDFLPWTLLLPLAFAARKRADAPDREGIAFAATWLGATVVFFTLVGGKRHLYLFAAFPAAAHLVGHGLARATEGRLLARGWCWVVKGTATALAVLGGAALVGSPLVAARVPELGIVAPAAVGASLLAGGLLARRLFFRKGLHGGALALPATVAASALVAFCVLLPRLDPLKSPRDFALALAARGCGEPILFWEVPPEGYRFYSGIDGRKATNLDEVLAAAGSDAPPLLVTTDRALDRLRPSLSREPEPLVSGAVGHRRVVLVDLATAIGPERLREGAPPSRSDRRLGDRPDRSGNREEAPGRPSPPTTGKPPNRTGRPSTRGGL